MPVVGVEDGSFQKGITRKTVLAAVLLKRYALEDVRTADILVDGLDATEKLIKLLRGWMFNVVFLAGISFAGFNVADPKKIHEQFRTPVIVVTRTKPDNMAVKRALQRHFEDWETRWDVFVKLGPFLGIVTSVGKQPIYVATIGENPSWACKLVRTLCVCGRVPEPIRVARLIARGLS
ncbi:MAG: DUF99 family protein [Candidatus Bathyarchaeota archaeon]|nr:DUF99 family protein [Candidatus Bathyarchaeota archaeon A05DMB-5]MDH7557245.1 DUF99 family protein [Candidatus Bathyarchaeota archaeon]